MPDIDLSAFTTESNTHAQKFSFKADFKVLVIIGVFFFGLVAIQVIMSLSPILTAAGLILIPVWIFYKNWRFKQTQKAVISRLASDNGWSLDQPTPEDAYKAGPKVNLPIDPMGRLAGEFSDLPFWLCIDNQATYLFIDSKRELPRSIFISSAYDSGPMRLVIGAFLNAEGLAPVTLEGDFDKYFRLYVEPAATINTLSVVAPDFMSSLIESGSVSSIMFADHYCFVKAYGDNQKNLKSLLVAGQALAKQLSDH